MYLDVISKSLEELQERLILCKCNMGFMCSTDPFQFRWLKGYIYSSCYYHHQIRSINLSHCYHIFPWSCVWDVCYIRKSKDYVYGIWVYKALDIWKGYYRVKKSLVSYVKPWTEGRNNEYMKYHSKLTYQLSFWNVSRKVNYHAGGKWFIHGPKRRKENQLLSLKHPCWLSLV